MSIGLLRDQLAFIRIIIMIRLEDPLVKRARAEPFASQTYMCTPYTTFVFSIATFSHNITLLITCVCLTSSKKRNKGLTTTVKAYHINRCTCTLNYSRHVPLIEEKNKNKTNFCLV